MASTEPASRPRRNAGKGAAGAAGIAGNGSGAPDRPAPTLRILDARVLRGPNYWAREPVVRMLVDLGVLEHFPSNLIPGFTDALVGLLPSLEDHACSLGRRGGFITRLRDGTWVGHIAEHVALELQNLAGTDVRHGKTRGAGPVGHYNVSTSTARKASASRPARSRSAWSTTSSTPRRHPSSICWRSWSGSSGWPSGARSGRPPRPSSTRR